MNGTIKIERESGSEVFGFSDWGDLSWTSIGGSKASVCLTAEADCVLEALDFTEDVCSSPIIESQIIDSDFSPGGLQGKKYDQRSSRECSFYYAEHLELRQVEIEITSQDGETCCVRWTGVSDDNYSKTQSEVRIRVEGIFKISQMFDSRA